MRTIPTDSADARDQRELEAEQSAADAAASREHDEQCRAGWLGEDDHGRPIACTTCRPHLLRVACWTCGQPWATCHVHHHQDRLGPCCEHCDHQPGRHTHQAAA